MGRWQPFWKEGTATFTQTHGPIYFPVRFSFPPVGTAEAVPAWERELHGAAAPDGQGSGAAAPAPGVALGAGSRGQVVEPLPKSHR